MEHLEHLLRLVAALLITGLIGWEREQASKPAGARTHAIVGVTAALYALLGTTSTGIPDGAGVVRTDPIRTIQAIATGVGFLGAGLIFRDGSRVKGLTTAASVWACAAVGVATAWAQWWLALGSAALILAALRWPFKNPNPTRLQPREAKQRASAAGGPAVDPASHRLHAEEAPGTSSK